MTSSGSDETNSSSGAGLRAALLRRKSGPVGDGHFHCHVLGEGIATGDVSHTKKGVVGAVLKNLDDSTATRVRVHDGEGA